MYRQNFPDHPGMHNADGNSRRDRSPFYSSPTLMEHFKSSIVGISAGVLIVTVASWLLFWNEGRAVHRAKALADGLELVVPVHNTHVSANNEGRLVHVVGRLEVNDLYEDKAHGVLLRAARVRRLVNMYQWVEHEERREDSDHDGNTRIEVTYSYSEEWRNDLVRSDQFNSEAAHRNPTEFPIRTEEYTATSVSVGHFKLSTALLTQIEDFRTFTATKVPAQSTLLLSNGAFYHGDDPRDPQIGDLRITFQYSGMDNLDWVSVIGQQAAGMIISYPTQSGDTIELLYPGKLTAEEIFDREMAANTLLMWALRFGGWLGVYIGFTFLTQVLVTAVDLLPVARELLSLGVGLMHFSLATSTSLLVIACSWIVYRPVFGLALLAMATLPFILAHTRGPRPRAD